MAANVGQECFGGKQQEAEHKERMKQLTNELIKFLESFNK